jgi:hypothetical protein
VGSGERERAAEGAFADAVLDSAMLKDLLSKKNGDVRRYARASQSCRFREYK